MSLMFLVARKITYLVTLFLLLSSSNQSGNSNQSYEMKVKSYHFSLNPIGTSNKDFLLDQILDYFQLSSWLHLDLDLMGSILVSENLQLRTCDEVLHLMLLISQYLTCH
jgi:hypothetical protein